MSPGGHAATTVVASAATAYLSGSLSLVTAVALGGFVIDVDHAIDYVLFNRQRDLPRRPSSATTWRAARSWLCWRSTPGSCSRCWLPSRGGRSGRCCGATSAVP